jgi:molybdopterin converting factor small subunit
VDVDPADGGVRVVLPTALLRLFPGCECEPAVSARTVGALIDALDGRWPGMRDRLCDSRPRVRRHINIFVDGERATLETPLGPGAEVFIMTAISGG